MLLLFDLLFLSVHIGTDFKKSFLNLDFMSNILYSESCALLFRNADYTLRRFKLTAVAGLLFTLSARDQGTMFSELSRNWVWSPLLDVQYVEACGPNILPPRAFIALGFGISQV